MSWICKPYNEVPLSKINIEKMRFRGQTYLLPDLLTVDTLVRQFFAICIHPLMVINHVIMKIEYPLTRSGMFTDLHYYQAFRKYLWTCHKTFRNDWDFWQFASETAWLKMGDCEDSSILTGTGLRFYNNEKREENEKEVLWYVVLGRLYERDTERLLGYHAWIIVNMDGKWRLVETTLDTPYFSINDIPEIDVPHNRWEIENVIYEALIRFNDRYYCEWYESMKSYTIHDYVKMKRVFRKRKDKWKALRKAYEKRGFNIKVKV